MTMHTRKIRTLIVDDEPLARERVRSMTGQESDLEVIGEARDGAEAVDVILTQCPTWSFSTSRCRNVMALMSSIPWAPTICLQWCL